MGHLVFFALAALAMFRAEGAGLPEECQLKADVVFLVDTSRSISKRDYRVQVDFLANLTRHMNVSPKGTHVGAVSFSRKAHVEFYLNTFNDPQQLENKIRDIPFRQGDVTETYEGLRKAREELFSAAHEARSGVARIIIIVTDGNSWNKDATKHQAELVRKEGILVFAVGIGHRIDRGELADMATENSDTYVHTVESFSSLAQLKQDLIPAACNALTTTTVAPLLTTEPMSSDEAKKSCTGKKADVVFVLDKSSSITTRPFRTQLSFINEVIDIFKVSPDHTHVSVVTFDYKPKVEFDLDDYSSASEMKKAVLKINYTAGSTNTHLALEKVARYVLTPGGGARKGIARVVIVVTDGKSSDQKQTKYWADLLKTKFGAYVFAIGVGNETDDSELKDISSKPASNFTFEVREGYNALRTIKDILAIRACEVQSGDVFVRCQQNAVPSDVMFVTHFAHAGVKEVESSAELVREVAGGFMTSQGKVRVGLASSDCAQVSAVALGEAHTAQQFAKAVGIERRGGLEEALNEARLQVTTSKDSQQRVIVVVVHGPISDLKRAARQVMRARFAGVKFVFVGRDRAVKGELLNLASQRRGEGDTVLMESEGVSWGSPLWQTVLGSVCEELSPGQPLY